MEPLHILIGFAALGFIYTWFERRKSRKILTAIKARMGGHVSSSIFMGPIWRVQQNGLDLSFNFGKAGSGPNVPMKNVSHLQISDSHKSYPSFRLISREAAHQILLAGKRSDDTDTLWKSFPLSKSYMLVSGSASSIMTLLQDEPSSILEKWSGGPTEFSYDVDPKAFRFMLFKHLPDLEQTQSFIEAGTRIVAIINERL